LENSHGNQNIENSLNLPPPGDGFDYEKTQKKIGEKLESFSYRRRREQRETEKFYLGKIGREVCLERMGIGRKKFEDEFGNWCYLDEKKTEKTYEEIPRPPERTDEEFIILWLLGHDQIGCHHYKH